MGSFTEIKRKLIIPKTTADKVKMFLTTNPESESDCFSEDDTFSYTADFGNDIQMDISLCGVQFEEGEDNKPWTQAVLFNHGCEVCCSEPSDDYFGEWELEYKGVKYIAEVIAEPIQDVPMKQYLVACDLGGCCIQPYIVKVGDDYLPVSDDMKALKELIVKDYKPKWHSAHAAPDNCGGRLNICESNDKIPADALNIIAISRLDL